MDPGAKHPLPKYGAVPTSKTSAQVPQPYPTSVTKGALKGASQRRLPIGAPPNLPQNFPAQSGMQGGQPPGWMVPPPPPPPPPTLDAGLESPGAEGAGVCPICTKLKGCVSQHIAQTEWCRVRLGTLELPRHQELKKAVEQMLKDDDAKQEDTSKSPCPLCGTRFVWVAQHIAQSQKCKPHRGKLEDGPLKEEVETLVKQSEKLEALYAAASSSSSTSSASSNWVQCPEPSCLRWFSNPDSLQQHRDAKEH